MSFRLPDLLNRKVKNELTDILQSEMLAEKASALGHHGTLVERALAALRAFDAKAGGDPEERKVLLQQASHEVWCFFVQREICGLRDQKEVIRLYDIPQEVLVRLGAVEPLPPRAAMRLQR